LKNAIILHGTGDTPDLFWFPYIKSFLESEGYEVWLPQLPNADYPNLTDWLPYVLESGVFTQETIIVGHSAGAQLILSLLEKIDQPTKQAILVSGYAKALRSTAESEQEGEYNWRAIKGKSQQFIFINSDNDPWECTDTQGRIMLDQLGGVQIILKGEGHMGSQTYNQPYKEFPLLTRLIDVN
jgi:predicted alpha/beta hydrolase family esterase